jgi:hypothetical protein
LVTPPSFIIESGHVYPAPSTSPSAGSGKSGGAASPGKLSASHQHQVQQARLLAVVDQSRAPIYKSHDPDPTAPATPSSIDRANPYNQCSAKNLLKQANVTAAARMVSPITELSPISNLLPLVERLLGGAHVAGGGGGNKGVD